MLANHMPHCGRLIIAAARGTLNARPTGDVREVVAGNGGATRKCRTMSPSHAHRRALRSPRDARDSGENVMRNVVILFMSVLLWGCDETPPPGPEPIAPAEYAPAAEEARQASGTAPAGNASRRLEATLDAQPDEVKARYQHRHPKETLAFFGIEPGMTVVEGLPGTGWYSQILVPYLGKDGRLIGANYAFPMWSEFGFFGQDFIDSMETWTTDWPEQAKAWRGDDGAAVEAFDFGSMPDELAGQADAVLLIRALHNLARFESKGGFLTAAINDVNRVLKPGGIVGVVQHEARPEMPDDWAGGDKGYLKKQFVIDRFTAAGFEFVDETDINQNPKDQPTTEDVVWRLPPGYQTSGDDAALRAAMDEIGESNRMTLKFRKPGG
jgi:predicted methyltransferase